MTSPKKILFIINNLGIGGAERQVINTINEMQRLGVDVSLVTLAREPEKSFTKELKISSDKLQCIQFKNIYSLSSWSNLIKTIKTINPDLLITELWFANTVGRVAGWFAGVKKIISFEQNVYDNVKTKKMFFIDRLLQSYSTKIIAVSESVKKSLIRHGINEKRVDVLYNSVDLERFNISRERLSIRKELGIREQEFVFIFIGRLIHQKGVDVLIEAFKKVDKATLLIVGQGSDREVLEEQARKNGLLERIKFLGVRNDIPELFAASDCFVFPSRYEGLPLVVTEALASGIAIIVSDFEAALEVVTHNKSGLIVPRDDVEALSQAMIRIRDDMALRSSLGEQALREAKRFSIIDHVHAILRYT